MKDYSIEIDWEDGDKIIYFNDTKQALLHSPEWQEELMSDEPEELEVLGRPTVNFTHYVDELPKS